MSSAIARLLAAWAVACAVAWFVSGAVLALTVLAALLSGCAPCSHPLPIDAGPAFGGDAPCVVVAPPAEVVRVSGDCPELATEPFALCDVDACGSGLALSCRYVLTVDGSRFVDVVVRERGGELAVVGFHEGRTCSAVYTGGAR